ITFTRPLVQAAGGKLTVCDCTGVPVHVERQLVVALNVPPVLLLSMMSIVSMAADGVVFRVKFVVLIATSETVKVRATFVNSRPRICVVDAVVSKVLNDPGMPLKPVWKPPMAKSPNAVSLLIVLQR